MDTIRIQKSKRRKLGHTSAKLARGKAIEDIKKYDDDTFTVNGKIYKMPADLKNLPEFDWDDPENQKMVQREEEERIKKYGRLTCEQLDQICLVKEEILKDNPKLQRKKAFDLAWEKVTGKKLSGQSLS